MKNPIQRDKRFEILAEIDAFRQAMENNLIKTDRILYTISADEYAQIYQDAEYTKKSNNGNDYARLFGIRILVVPNGMEVDNARRSF